MTNEQIAQILVSLKIDLAITTTAYDTRLTELIKSSYQMITKEGATLDVSQIDDAQLVVMYASWLWNKRRSGEGMPRMLRLALNNRVLGEKARG